jgi:hypothetical protein
MGHYNEIVGRHSHLPESLPTEQETVVWDKDHVRHIARLRAILTSQAASRVFSLPDTRLPALASVPSPAPPCVAPTRSTTLPHLTHLLYQPQLRRARIPKLAFFVRHRA